MADFGGFEIEDEVQEPSSAASFGGFEIEGDAQEPPSQGGSVKNAAPVSAWESGDDGEPTLPVGEKNQWGGNLRTEGRKPLIRRDANGKASGYSTTSSMFVKHADGRIAVVPTVVDGRELSTEDAAKHYADTGEFWGMADDEESAKKIAGAVHDEHQKAYQKGWNDYIYEHWDEMGDEIRHDPGVRGERARRRRDARLAEEMKAWGKDAEVIKEYRERTKTTQVAPELFLTGDLLEDADGRTIKPGATVAVFRNDSRDPFDEVQDARLMEFTGVNDDGKPVFKEVEGISPQGAMFLGKLHVNEDDFSQMLGSGEGKVSRSPFEQVRLGALAETGDRSRYTDDMAGTARALFDRLAPFVGRKAPNEHLERNRHLSNIYEGRLDGYEGNTDAEKYLDAARKAGIEPWNPLDSFNYRPNESDEDLVGRIKEVTREELRRDAMAKLEAGGKLSETEASVMDKIVKGGIESGGYALEFALPGGAVFRGAKALNWGAKAVRAATMLGSAVPVVAAEATSRYQKNVTPEYGFDEKGEFKMVAAPDEEGEAAYKAIGGAIFDTGVEVGLESATMGLLRLAGKPVGWALGRATPGAVKAFGAKKFNKFMASETGQALRSINRAYQDFALTTGINSPFGELLEENVQAFEKVIGLDGRSSEYKGLAKEWQDFYDSQLSWQTQWDIFYGLIAQLAIGAAKSAEEGVAQHISSTDARRDARMALKRSDVSDETISTLTPKQQKVLNDMWQRYSADPDALKDRVKNLGMSMRLAVDELTARESSNIAADLKRNGIAPERFVVQSGADGKPAFQQMERYTSDGKKTPMKAMTDAAHGVTIVDGGDGTFYVMNDWRGLDARPAEDFQKAQAIADEEVLANQKKEAENRIATQRLIELTDPKTGRYRGRNVVSIPSESALRWQVAQAVRDGRPLFGITRADQLFKADGSLKQPGAGGFHTPDGHIVVILDNVPSPAEMERVLAHEATGHEGVESATGRGANTVGFIQNAQAEGFGKFVLAEQERAVQRFVAAGMDEATARMQVAAAMSTDDYAREAMARYAQGRIHQPTWYERRKHEQNQRRRDAGESVPIDQSDLEVMLAEAEAQGARDGGGYEPLPGDSGVEYFEVEKGATDEARNGADEAQPQPEQGEERGQEAPQPEAGAEPGAQAPDAGVVEPSNTVGNLRDASDKASQALQDAESRLSKWLKDHPRQETEDGRVSYGNGGTVREFRELEAAVDAAREKSESAEAEYRKAKKAENAERQKSEEQKKLDAKKRRDEERKKWRDENPVTAQLEDLEKNVLLPAENELEDLLDSDASTNEQKAEAYRKVREARKVVDDFKNQHKEELEQEAANRKAMENANGESVEPSKSDKGGQNLNDEAKSPKGKRGDNLRGRSYEDYAASPDDGGTADEMGAALLRFVRDNGGLLKMPPKGVADPMADWINAFLDGNARKNNRGEFVALFGMKPKTGANDAIAENMPSGLKEFVEGMIARDGPGAVADWFLETRRKYREWAQNRRNAAQEATTDAVERYDFDELAAAQDAMDEEFANALGVVEGADEADYAALAPASLQIAKSGDTIRFDHDRKSFVFGSFDAGSGVLVVYDEDVAGMEGGKFRRTYRVTENSIEEIDDGQGNEVRADADRAGNEESPAGGGGEAQGGAGFQLESVTAEQITAEQKKRAEKEAIKKRQEAPLKGSGAVNVQPEMDLGQTGQQDLFPPIAENEKIPPAAKENAAERPAEYLAWLEKYKMKDTDRHFAEWQRKQTAQKPAKTAPASAPSAKGATTPPKSADAPRAGKPAAGGVVKPKPDGKGNPVKPEPPAPAKPEGEAVEKPVADNEISELAKKRQELQSRYDANIDENGNPEDSETAHKISKELDAIDARLGEIESANPGSLTPELKAVARMPKSENGESTASKKPDAPKSVQTEEAQGQTELPKHKTDLPHSESGAEAIGEVGERKTLANGAVFEIVQTKSGKKLWRCVQGAKWTTDYGKSYHEGTKTGDTFTESQLDEYNGIGDHETNPPEKGVEKTYGANDERVYRVVGFTVDGKKPVLELVENPKREGAAKNGPVSAPKEEGAIKEPVGDGNSGKETIFDIALKSANESEDVKGEQGDKERTRLVQNGAAETVVDYVGGNVNSEAAFKESLDAFRKIVGMGELERDSAGVVVSSGIRRLAHDLRMNKFATDEQKAELAKYDEPDSAEATAAPAAEPAKIAPASALKKTGATMPPKASKPAEVEKSATGGVPKSSAPTTARTSAKPAFKRGDRVFLKGAKDGQRVTFLKANANGTADVQVRTPGANRYAPEKVETRTVPMGEISSTGMKDTLTGEERNSYRRGVAEQTREAMRSDPALQRIDAAYRAAKTDAERAALKAQFAERVRALQGGVNFDTPGIYTGTAADYANRSRQGGVDDGPSVKKIGTGEGSQVYGWGLYGSTERGVAEGYAKADKVKRSGNLRVEQMSKQPRKVLLDGKPIEFDRWGKNEERSPEAYAAKCIYQLDGDMAKAEEALSRAEGYVAKAALEWMRNNKGRITPPDPTPKAQEQLYEQTWFTDRAPGDESHLLKWYEDLPKEQVDWIAQEFAKEGFFVASFSKLKGWTILDRTSGKKMSLWDKRESGETYEAIASFLGSPQAASEFLYRAGIDGVKYPVDSYGGKGVKDGDDAGWNYVAFSDEHIRVDHKWTDGILQFDTPELTPAEAEKAYREWLGKYRLKDTPDRRREWEGKRPSARLQETGGRTEGESLFDGYLDELLGIAGATPQNPLGQVVPPPDGSVAQAIDAEIAADEARAARGAARSQGAPPVPAPGSQGNERLDPGYEPESLGAGVKDPVSRQEIVDKFRELFSGTVAIRGKNTTRIGKYAGHYEPDAGIIRSKDPVSLRTIPHELGHHIDAVLKKHGPMCPNAVKAELIALGKKLYGGKQPAGGYQSEGFAEMVKYYLQGNEEGLKKGAPAAYGWLVNDFGKAHPDIMEKMDALRDMIDRFQNQSGDEAVRAIRAKDPNLAERIVGRLADMVKGLKLTQENWIDTGAFITKGMRASGLDRLMDWRAALKRGDVAEMNDIIENHPVLKWKLYNGKSAARAYQALAGGLTDLSGTRRYTYGDLGMATPGHAADEKLPTFKEIFGGFTPEEMDEFENYAIARIAKEAYLDKGLEFGLTKSEIAPTLAKHARNTKFRDALERYTHYKHGVLHLLVDAGAMSQEQFEEIVKANPIYVKIARRRESADLFRDRMLKKRGKAVNRRTGSGRQVEDIFDAGLVDDERVFSAAFQADLLRSLVNLGKRGEVNNAAPGGALQGELSVGANWIHEVPNAQGAVRFTAEQLRKQITDAMRGAAMAPDKAAADNLFDQLFSDGKDILTVFKQKPSEGKNGLVSLYDEDGALHTYELPENNAEGWAKGLMGFTDPKKPNILEQWAQIAAAATRTGATILNPTFALRNIVRDTLHASTVNEFGFMIPGASTVQGIAMDMMGSNAKEIFDAMGIPMGSMLGESRLQSARRANRYLMSRNWFEAQWNKGVKKAIADFVGFSENGTRIKEFKLVRDYMLSHGASEKAADMLAGANALDITIDFQRGGEVAKSINRFIPFFNAGIQGLEQTARALGLLRAKEWQLETDRKKRAGRTVIQGAAWLLMLSLLAELFNRSDDDRKKKIDELKPHERWNYISFGDVRLPVPYEIGYIFSSIPRAVIAELYDGQKGAVAECLGMFRQTLPGISPTDIAFIGPALNTAMNEYWHGGTIVPEYVQKSKLSYDWYDERTSEFSKMLGKAMYKVFGHGKISSPAHIDAFMNGITGNMYGRTLGAIGGQAELDASRPNTWPVVGTFFRNNLTASRLVGEFYERKIELERKKGSGVATERELAELHNAGKLAKRFAELRKESQKAKEDESLSVTERNDRLEKIVLEMQQGVRDYNKDPSGGDETAYEIEVKAFEKANGEYKKAAKDKSVPRAEWERRLSGIREGNPLMRDDVRGKLLALKGNIAKLERNEKALRENGASKKRVDEVSASIAKKKVEFLDEVRKARGGASAEK